jgi:hypothetical protein
MNWSAKSLEGKSCVTPRCDSLLVSFIFVSLADFHAGDRGSNPLGDAKQHDDMTGKLGSTDFPVFVEAGIQGRQRAPMETGS